MGHPSAARNRPPTARASQAHAPSANIPQQDGHRNPPGASALGQPARGLQRAANRTRRCKPAPTGNRRLRPATWVGRPRQSSRRAGRCRIPAMPPSTADPPAVNMPAGPGGPVPGPAAWIPDFLRACKAMTPHRPAQGRRTQRRWPWRQTRRRPSESVQRRACRRAAPELTQETVALPPSPLPIRPGRLYVALRRRFLRTPDRRSRPAPESSNALIDHAKRPLSRDGNGAGGPVPLRPARFQCFNGRPAVRKRAFAAARAIMPRT